MKIYKIIFLAQKMVKNQFGIWVIQQFMGFYVVTLLKFFVPSHITHKKSVKIENVYFCTIF